MGRTVGMLVLVVILIGAAWAGFSWRSRQIVFRPQSPGKPSVVSGSLPTRSSPLPAMDTRYRADAVETPDWFEEVGSESGVDFVHRSGNSPEKPFPSANGSGMGVLDYDRDGQEDLYFATGTDFPLDERRTEPFNRLYRAVGPWRFQEVTFAAAASHAGFSAGVAVGDFDNDGFPDVYVTCYGKNCLFQNMGDGTFVRCEDRAAVADDRWGASAAWLDGNHDGWLDLYVCNYAKWTLETHQYCGDRTRNIRVHCSPTSVEPEDDVYFVNQGDGTFRDASREAGLRVQPGRGQGVVAADFDQDGLTDLYVANDLNANMLFWNRGDGTFEDASEASGTAHDWRGTNQAGMGVDAADYNGDGRVDLIVTNYSDEHNVVYENLTGRLFRDNSRAANLVASSLPWIGWGVALLDFNQDGAPDLLVTNGHVDDNRHLLGQDAPYFQPPLLWRGNFGRFELLKAPGEYFRQLHVGRALVIVDPDNNGVPDVVIGHQDARPALLRNVIVDHLRACTIRLHGSRSNRDAIGATLIARCGEQERVQPVKSGGSYLSSSTAKQFLTLGEPGQPRQLLVKWPGGHTSVVADVAPGYHYDIYEPTDILPLRIISWKY